MSLNRVLSQREDEVVRVKKEGLLDKEIALKLNISYWTVRSYIARAKIKLDCVNTFHMLSKYPEQTK